MANDNTLGMQLSMKQAAPDGQLSDTNLSVNFPNIEREAANAYQHEAVFQHLRSNVKFAALQAVALGRKDAVDQYTGILQTWIGDLGASLSMIGEAAKDIPASPSEGAPTPAA